MRNLLLVLVLAFSVSLVSCGTSKKTPKSVSTTVKEKKKRGKVVQRTTTTVERF